MWFVGMTRLYKKKGTLASPIVENISLLID